MALEDYKEQLVEKLSDTWQKISEHEVSIQLTERERKVEVKCEIKNFRFSAHSRHEEILSLVNTLDPSNILLVHGESDAVDWVGASILKNFPHKKVFACSLARELRFD